MSKKEIIARTGVSKRHLNYILCNQRKPSSKLASKLEKITGIKRLQWLYPEEYGNPYISLEHFAHDPVKNATKTVQVLSDS